MEQIKNLDDMFTGGSILTFSGRFSLVNMSTTKNVGWGAAMGEYIDINLFLLFSFLRHLDFGAFFISTFSNLERVNPAIQKI